MVVGIVFGVIVLVGWVNSGLGSLSHEDMTLTAATLVMVGLQIFFTSFLLSILGLRRDPSTRSSAATTATSA
jgi:hypothetical protein